jgi:hypothetical protein
MYHYYLGHHDWVTDDPTMPMGYFAPPSPVVGSVDLRIDRAQQESRVFMASKEQLGREYFYLGSGDCRELATTARMQNAWASATGYRPSGDRLVDLLWDHMTVGADPRGEAACKPLMPNRHRKLRLLLPGHSCIKSQRFRFGKHQHTNKVNAMIRLDIARILEQEDDEIAGKVLAFKARRYQLKDKEWEILRPATGPGRTIRPRKPTTVITESFDTSDSTTLGPDLTWDEFYGNGEVFSNVCCPVGNPGTAELRATTALSSDDQYAQNEVWEGIKTTGVGLNAGGITRKDNSSTRTYYWGVAMGNSNHQYVRIYSVSAGSFTKEGQSAGYSITFNSHTWYTSYFESDGTDHTFYWEGTEELSVSDSGISGNLYSGLRLYNIAGSSRVIRADDFEAGDLGGDEEDNSAAMLLSCCF